jgi:hypothetical protein
METRALGAQCRRVAKEDADEKIVTGVVSSRTSIVVRCGLRSQSHAPSRRTSIPIERSASNAGPRLGGRTA